MIISWGTGKDWRCSEFIRNWLLAKNSLSRLSKDPRFYLGAHIVIFVQKVLGIFSFNNNGNFMARSFSSGALHSLGVQGWRSGESTRLPPMWPEFDSQIRRQMWIEDVGSLLCT